MPTIPATDDLLLQSHALAEVAFRPVRHAFVQGKLAPKLFALRRSGARLPTFGGNAQSWKRNQRARDELADRRLWQGGGINREGMRLVRSWVFLVERETIVEALQRIRTCVSRNWCRKNGWVPECFVAGASWGGDVNPIIDAQVLLTPALVDQWVESQGTTAGHTFYRIAPHTDIDAAIDGSYPATADDFREDYFNRYLDHVLQLHRMIVSGSLKIETGGELGQIPFPVAEPLLDEKQPYNDGGFPPLFPN